MKTILTTLLTLAVLAVFGGFAFIYSGAYNVAATNKHSSLVRWILHTTMEKSVERRAQNINPPANITLSDPKTIETGFMHYNEMCVICHGAPGIEPGEAHDGLNPTPPALAEHAKEMSAGELFWVVKNGIRMTGMPAWGPTHSDDKIWAMVAFLKALPGITPAQYKTMQAAASQAPGDDDHDHDH